MNPLRKISGFIIAVLLGVPVLFGTIVAIGLTKATVSTEFLTEMPREIIEKLPGTLDQLYLDIKEDDLRGKDELWPWLDAMKKTGIDPSKILEDSGIMKWMKGELSDNFKQLGRVLRGEISADTINMDMTELKNSILSPVITSYMTKVILKLPQCSDTEIERWKELILSGNSDFFPRCRPAGVEITPDLVREIQRRFADKIPQSVSLFQGGKYIPRNFNIPEFISTASYFLFIFPLLLIVLGSIVAATSMQGFLRWSGISVLLGGLSAYAFGNLLNNIVPIAEKFSSNPYLVNNISTRYNDILSEKIIEFSDVVMNRLFEPVSHLGGIVAVIGLIVFALSFLNRDKQ